MMRTILLYILLLLSALLTFSCKERPEVSSTLDRAETLIWESPDSALQLLEALPTSKRIDEESRARHALLLSQARYRCYVPTTSDSLINYMNRFCKDIGLSDSGKKAFYIYINSLLEFKRK